MSDLVGKGGLDLVLKFVTDKLLPKQAAKQAKREDNCSSPYLDPGLQEGRRCAQLLRRLWGAGLVGPPEDLRGFFGLPRIKMRQLVAAGVELPGLRRCRRVWPRFAALPTGWSHALDFCQCIATRAADSVGLTPSERLEDGREAPP